MIHAADNIPEDVKEELADEPLVSVRAQFKCEIRALERVHASLPRDYN